MPEDPQKAALIARMEELGEAQMRLLMQNGGWPQTYHAATIEWLAKKDQEASARRLAVESEQIEIARNAAYAAERAAMAAERASSAAERQLPIVERQALAAERANTRATIALAIAAISIITASVSIWVSHRDTTHQGVTP